MKIIIPDEIRQSIGVSETDLKLEVAILLYKKYNLSSGKARKIAGMNLVEFRHELTKRDISVHYNVEDFENDIETLKELGQL